MEQSRSFIFGECCPNKRHRAREMTDECEQRKRKIRSNIKLEIKWFGKTLSKYEITTEWRTKFASEQK